VGPLARAPGRADATSNNLMSTGCMSNSKMCSIGMNITVYRTIDRYCSGAILNDVLALNVER
jgi:hypothetical protein